MAPAEEDAAHDFSCLVEGGDFAVERAGQYHGAVGAQGRLLQFRMGFTGIGHAGILHSAGLLCNAFLWNILDGRPSSCLAWAALPYGFCACCV